jgi:hypothetical protein
MEPTQADWPISNETARAVKNLIARAESLNKYLGQITTE